MSDRKITRFLTVATLAAMQLSAAQVITVTLNTDTAQAAGGAFTSTSATDLRGAINWINTQTSLNGPYTIVFGSLGTPTITLSAPLPPINFSVVGTTMTSNQVIIDGSNGSATAASQMTIAGNGFRPFYAYQGPVTIQNMTISAGKALGGNGGSGAGGAGAGLGGGVFVDQAQVTLNNVKFSGCSVQGGSGGAVSASGNAGGVSGGGGGGMGGNGGASAASSTASVNSGSGGGGGAFTGVGGAGGSATGSGRGGSGGGAGSFMGGALGGNTTTGTSAGGGGGGGYGGVVATNTGTGGSTSAGSAGSAATTGGTGTNLGGGGGGGGSGGGAGGSGNNGAGSFCSGATAGGTNSGGGGGLSTGINPCSAGNNVGALSANGGQGGGGGGQGDVGVTTSTYGGNGGPGGGGGGNSWSQSTVGGSGGYFGGGGGGGGGGGFGGGGGGGGTFATINGGNGGFGGGGGGCGGGGVAGGVHNSGNGGFGGGAGGLNNNTSLTSANLGSSGVGGGFPSSTVATSGGGGGAALGSAVFMTNNSTASLTITTNSSTTNYSSVPTATSTSTALANASTSGSSNAGYVGPLTGAGVQELFAMSGTTINIAAINAADTVTIGATIADDSSTGIPASTTYLQGNGKGASVVYNSGGALGKVLLQGTGTAAYGGVNSTTTLAGGTLNIASDASLGGSSVPFIFSGSSTLQPNAAIASSIRPLTVNSGVIGSIDTSLGNLTTSGTLTMSSGSVLQKINTGTLTMNQSNNSPGAYTVSGGTMVLGATNTYSGATTINAGGTLQAGAINTLSSLSQHTLNGNGILNLNGTNNQVGSIVSTSSSSSVTLGGATLTTNGDGTSTTFAGVISGAGGLTKIGTGILRLSGTNTYTGTTTVTNGTFHITVSGSTVSPVIANSGTTLTVNGTVSNAVTVNSGALFNGMGKITGGVTNNGGTIKPGTSIGTLTFGSYIEGSTSTLTIEFSPTATSSIVVNGPATLGGTLNLLQDPGTYAEKQTYTFLTASGGVSGTFSSITNIPSGFSAQLIYQPTSVQLLLLQPSLLASSLNLSGNNGALFSYLQALSSIPAIGTIYNELVLSSNVNAALSSISPARNAAAAYISNQVAFGIGSISVWRLGERRILNRILEQKMGMAALSSKQESLVAMAKDAPVPSVPADYADVAQNSSNNNKQKMRHPSGQAKNMAAQEQYSFWGTGFGDFIRQTGQNGNPTIHDTSAGGLVGFDYYGYLNGIFTASAGYVHNSITEANNAGSGHSNGGIAAIYGTGNIGYGYVEGGVLGGYNRFNMNRNMAIPGQVFKAKATSSFNCWQVMPHIGGGYDWVMDWGVIEPFVAVDWAVTWQGSFHESGASPINMTVKSKTPNMLRSQIGINAYENWDSRDTVWILEEMISYVNKVPFNTKMNAAIVVAPTSVPFGAPSSFTVQSYNQTLNLFSAGAELFFKDKASGFFFSAAYQGEFGSGYMSNDVQGTVGVFY